MTGVGWAACIVVLVAGVPLAAATQSHVQAMNARSVPPPVAVSLQGSIVLFAADGHGRTVITTSGRDHAPQVAPNGRAIAFWRAYTVGEPAVPERIMLATPNGRGGWWVRPFSPPLSRFGQGQETFAWAPGSKALAWFDNSTVQYRRLGGSQRTVLNTGSGTLSGAGLALAFAPDGGTVAATLPTAGQELPRDLRVAVRHLNAPAQRTIVIAFRPGLLVGRTPRGSTPVTDELGYTSSQLAPRGHTLQIATITVGAGRQLSGVFLAPDTGGRARLVQGNGHGLHGIPPFGYGLDGATHFQIAPNGRYTATDPVGGFYVAGQNEFHVSVSVPTGCVLAQWTWLANSVHMADVTECTVPGSGPIRYRLTLSTVSIHGGYARVLYRTESSDPNAIDLAPAYRCVACG